MNKEDLQKKLVPWFELFHRRPELGHEEYETTARIREILAGIGVEIPDTGLKTGLVACIGAGSPVVALRCDIDALPVNEESGLPYASENPGCMHACGHDFHTAAMLGAAMLLREEESRLRGSVKLIFQPGEETASGSAEVLATGALDDIREIYGLHVSPELPAGQIGVSPGAAYAAVGDFSMRIRGKGGHAGYPHLSRDPIIAMGQIICAAQTIVSRTVSPFEPSVVSITHAEGGRAWNVISPEAFVEGTIRSLGTEKFSRIAERLGEIVKGVELSSGTSIEYRWRMSSPAVDNDPALTEFVAETARELGLPTGPSVPSMGGEDFSLYQQRVKGVFWNIGVGSPEGLHHPRFIASPAPLSSASSLLARLAEKALIRLDGMRSNYPEKP
jgi:amidohydrolase